jgi:hypothetical protein
MANTFFSGRIPPDLYDKIEQHCNEFGESKTKVLIDALTTYLNFPISVKHSTPNNQISKELFSALEERVKTLEELAKATKKSEAIVINDDNYDNKVSSELEFTPSIEAKQSDDKNDNSDNKQLEIDNIIKFNNNNDNSVVPEVSITYGPVNESQMAMWIGKDRNLLRRHRGNVEKEKLSLNTPLIVEVNGQSYELKYVSEKKPNGKTAREWVAKIVDNADNTNNKSVFTHQENSD